MCLLVFYSLLSEELRFSRAIVLLGSLWSILATIGIRMLLSLMHVDGYRLRPDKGRRYLIVGDNDERQRVYALFSQLGIESAYVKTMKSLDADNPDALRDAITDNDDPHKNVNEIIFCSKNIEISTILDITEQLRDKGIAFRIAPEGIDVLIGSNYTNSPDDLYTPDFGNIDNATNRRSKRLFDIIAASALIVLSPILFWPQKRKRRYFADCIAVLVGRKSWVGYSRPGEARSENDEPLPNIRRGVFRTRDLMPRVKNPDCKRLDNSYATDYRVATDMNILFINLLNI